MQINENISDLIGSIYESAFTVEDWEDLVERLSKLMDMCSGGIWRANDETLEIPFYANWNEDPEASDAFDEHYVFTAPRTYFDPRRPEGQIYSCEGLYAFGEWPKSELFNGWYLPNGFGSCTSAIVWKSPKLTARFCLMKPLNSERTSRAGKDLLAFLLPHFRRSLQLQYHFDLFEGQRNIVSDVLDALPFGVILVDAKAKVLQANGMAQDMLREGDGLLILAKTMCAARPEESKALAQRIGAAALTGAGDGVHSGGPLRVSRPSLKRDYEVLVSPIGRRAFLDQGVGTPAAIVIITDPEHHTEPPHERLQRLYGLSPAEAWVAWGIASGRRQTELAEERGISPETVRTYLRRARDKTDAKRTADLVRLILTGPAMLNGSGK
ncbi:MAG: helix-turn-helix transcriptional regulator [Alphaproteobacteria bacterium]|nr:helix-turn-helix transcriptional regulator [Alphaproteobacteria bacterium]